MTKGFLDQVKLAEQLTINKGLQLYVAFKYSAICLCPFHIDMLANKLQLRTVSTETEDIDQFSVTKRMEQLYEERDSMKL